MRPPAPALGQALRDALREHLPPGVLEGFGRDAMARVEATTKKRAGAPDGPAAPAPATDCEGVDAMGSMPHHEEASLYGTGLVCRPLSGRPEFRGLIDSADGPIAFIQDGDLVLRVDDVETLTRWRAVFDTATDQLQRHQERLARAEQQREVQP